MIGSIYIRSGVTAVDHINNSCSTGRECAGIYPSSISIGSVFRYIGVHRSSAASVFGFSAQSSNGQYSEFVAIDCQNCNYVFRLYTTALEVSDVFLWKVPSGLRDTSSPSYKLVIINLYTDVSFSFDLETISVSKVNILGDIPKAEVTFCRRESAISCRVRPNPNIILEFGFIFLGD